MDSALSGGLATMFRLTSRVLDLCQEFPNTMINCSCMTGLYDLGTRSGDWEFSQPGTHLDVTQIGSTAPLRRWVHSKIHYIWSSIDWRSQVSDWARVIILKVRMTGRTGRRVHLGAFVIQHRRLSCRAPRRNIATHHLL